MKPGLLLQILGSQWRLLQLRWAVRKGLQLFCLSTASHGRILFTSSPIWWFFISAHTSLTERRTGTAALVGDFVTENTEAKGSRAGEEINCYMCCPFFFFFCNLIKVAGGEQFSQIRGEINELLSCKTAEPSTETQSYTTWGAAAGGKNLLFSPLPSFLPMKLLLALCHHKHTEVSGLNKGTGWLFSFRRLTKN